MSSNITSADLFDDKHVKPFISSSNYFFLVMNLLLKWCSISIGLAVSTVTQLGVKSVTFEHCGGVAAINSVVL